MIKEEIAESEHDAYKIQSTNLVKRNSALINSVNDAKVGKFDA